MLIGHESGLIPSLPRIRVLTEFMKTLLHALNTCINNAVTDESRRAPMRAYFFLIFSVCVSQ
jgi:hypothetical protein